MRDDATADPVDRIYDALDAGEPERALAEASAALVEADDDPVLRMLAGVALLDLDRPAEARAALERALELDPDDPDTRAQLALAHYRTLDVERAEAEARAALERDPRSPDAHHALGLALELRGSIADADRHLERAVALDAERFPPAQRLTREAFDERMRHAIGRLPAAFREHLERVAVTVDDVPAVELLAGADPPFDPELLGLFEGPTLGEARAFDGPPELPPRIWLFKRNLERFAEDDEDLTHQIEITLRHELGHYLGLDEDELADSGYA